MTQPGYEIGRDAGGLTKREREVLDLLMQGRTLAEAAKEIGVTKQRVTQIARALVKKGRLLTDGSGRYGVPIQKESTGG